MEIIIVTLIIQNYKTQKILFLDTTAIMVVAIMFTIRQVAARELDVTNLKQATTRTRLPLLREVAPPFVAHRGGSRGQIIHKVHHTQGVGKGVCM